MNYALLFSSANLRKDKQINKQTNEFLSQTKDITIFVYVDQECQTQTNVRAT